MMKLRTYPAGFGCPSLSPFCVKAMHLLTASGAPWQAEITTDPRKAPKRKLPVLVDGDDFIADSCAIRAHLEARTGTDFDAGLSERDRAYAHSITRLAEEHLYFACVWDRWVNPDHWSIVRATYFAEVPGLVRGVVTRSLQKGAIRDLDGQGLGRFSEAELCIRVKADLEALKAVIQGDFLFGNRPCSADYSAGPMVQALAASPGRSKLKSMVTEDTVLMDYSTRVAALLDGQTQTMASAA